MSILSPRYQGWQRAAQLLFLFVPLFGLLSACSDSEQKFSGPAQGTSYHITVVDSPASVDMAQLARQIDSELAAIDLCCSNYRDDSELAQLNAAPVGEPLAVGEHLFEVLTLALEVSWLSNGAFDVTVGELITLWGFGPAGSEKQHIPADESISEAQAHSGYQQLSLNLARNEVTRQGQLLIDLSAIAPGYTADRIAALLEGQGITRYMVEIGGELRVRGRNAKGKPWRIAIEQPDAPPGTVHRAIALEQGGIATSGDYRNYFEQDGQRFSHTLDPRSGRPITHALASVTVVAENAAYADALATALNVLGPDEALQLAEAQKLAVYLIVKRGDDFETRHSEAFAAYLAP